MKHVPLLVLCLFLASCTSVKVQEIDPTLEISHVCIRDNPKVIVSEFVPVVRKGFDRHGITTEVYHNNRPRHCEFYLTYTALKSWDMAMYMHHAELYLYQGNQKIAYAEYHLAGKGGLALNKWASVESKMDPVIDKLLAGYSPEIVDTYRKAIPTKGESTTESGDAKAAQLRELKIWFGEGLITEQEYNAAKQKVLNQ